MWCCRVFVGMIGVMLATSGAADDCPVTERQMPAFCHMITKLHLDPDCSEDLIATTGTIGGEERESLAKRDREITTDAAVRLQYCERLERYRLTCDAFWITINGNPPAK